VPKMLIGEDRVDARSGESMAVIDPATEEVIDSVPAGGQEDVDAAVAAARAALPEW
jgi:acyl-CoA reductase-like NAD-dependent aldehyde dehydrogenase